MLRNYFILTLRHLWRNRSFTILNAVGLAIGISAAWIMYQYVSYEFSYDAPQPDRERVYRVVSRFTMDGEEGGNAGIPIPLAREVASVAGVELVASVFDTWVSNVQAGGSGGPVFEDVEQVVIVNENYFRLVPYQWLAGSPPQPGQTALAQSRAEKYFPGLGPEAILGQTLIYNDTLLLHVSGVVADLPYPSSFIGREFRAAAAHNFDENRWGSVNSGDQLYLRLAEGADAGAVLAQINRISDEKSGEAMKKWNMSRKHELQPLAEVHFVMDYVSRSRVANKKVLYALMGVAVFLLLLACINYVNLATAQIPQRAREIGIRKTLGSSRSTLLLHFLGETAIVVLVAIGLAGLLTTAFFQYYRDVLPEDVLKYVHYGPTILFLAVLTVVVSLLSGAYPAWLVGQAQPVRVLRGQADSGGSRRASLRKGLIVFQFAVAQVFIIGAVIMGRQLHFAMHKDLGFNRDAVVLVETPWKLRGQAAYKDKQFVLCEALRQLPGVEQAALGDPLFSRSYSSNSYSSLDASGEEIRRNVYQKYVDTELIPLYELPLLAGRNLLPSDTAREYVINEAAVRAFGFASPQAALGQFLSETEAKALPIVGVVGDFHTASFFQEIDPLLFASERSYLSILNIRLASRDPADWSKTLAAIEAKWKEIYPSAPFEYEFYDDELRYAYEEELQTARIINLATGVALLISCLGLFGLATFMANRRTKEIGIRKVLGASAVGITGLLAKDFLKLVLIAIVIASPIAYYFMQKWLDDFAYRIELQWWMFALSGAAALMIAFLTVSFQSVRAALANPVESLRSE
jgi:putative ABC transport system permease protein